MEDLVKSMADFPGNIVGWKITSNGERQYFDDEFRNQLREANKASIKANLSSIETNTSIKLLNEEIIPKFNRFQKLVSVVTLIVAGLSLVAIALSAYYASAGVTSKDVESLKKQLEKNTSILDSLRRYEKGIDSSLRRNASDTLHHKTR